LQTKHISTTSNSLHKSATCWCNYYSKWRKCHRNEQNVCTCSTINSSLSKPNDFNHSI